MNTWPIYLHLQGELAIGGAPEIIEHLEVPGDGFERALLIGAAIDEVRMFRSQRHGEVHVLCAYQPELDAIRDQVAGVDVHVGDMHDTPFQTGSFSFVHSANVLEHALAPYIALTECRRLLRDGGKAEFTIPSFAGQEGGKGPFHLHCLTSEVWMELLRKTGFTVDSTYCEQGTLDPEVSYNSYRCTAVIPPHPHDSVREALIRYKAGES